MLKNHLLLTFRALRRDKVHASLGGLSLATALACCALVALFARDELAYDRFHAHAERIAFVGQESLFGDEPTRFPSTPYPLADALVDGLPEVEAAVLTSLLPGEGRVRQPGWDRAKEARAVFVGPAFFEVFSFPLVRGDARTALAQPGTAIVTASASRRLFGAADPIGQTVVTDHHEGDTLTVVGVAADVPAHSTLQFDLVASSANLPAAMRAPDSWGSSQFNTYALLKPGVTARAFQSGLERFAAARGEGEETAPGYLAVPLPALYFSDLRPGVAEGFRGDPRYLYLFTTVAAFVLLLGAINYVNLATARAARRAREVGVRKSIGAGRGTLVHQFLTESVVLSLIAAALAAVLAALALPAFNAVFGTALALGALDAPFALGLLAAAVLVGLLAGAYPALYLSAFEPIGVLRGGTGGLGPGAARARLRRGLVVFQFTVAVALLAGTAVVLEQLAYTRERDLGFGPDRLVTLSLWEAGLTERADVVKAALAASPAVEAAAAGTPPTGFNSTLMSSPDPLQPERAISVRPATVDPDYFDTVGLELAAGRWFNADRPGDLARGHVVNEALVRELGWRSPAEALGRTLTLNDTEGEVIGVVRDFHFATLREPVAPAALAPARTPSGEGPSTAPTDSSVVVRLAAGREREGLAAMERAWTRLAPDVAFEPEFVDEELAARYEAEERLSRAFGVFAGVTVLVACLGLFGLVAYTTEQRTKEVGVRKVLGASAASLVVLLSKDVLQPVLVAAALAAPLAYVLMGRWLEGFAYHVALGPGVFVVAGALALLVALATVASQALRAAQADPVKSLRYE